MIREFGTWPSPIAAARVAEQGLRLSSVAIDGDAVYWLEGRPAEGGRNALVRWRDGEEPADVLPVSFNVRTRVYEYGGGAYAAHGGVVYAASFADGRLYRVRGGESPAPITPEEPCHYADITVDAARQRLVCVREDHRDAGEPLHAIVSIPAGGASSIPVLAAGRDFYSTPRLSPDGGQLCWLCWDHPSMPWDGTELWLADVRDDGSLTRQRRIAGGPAESIYQPGWTPDGTLCFVSDRTGWWQIYRWRDGEGGRGTDSIEPVLRDAPPDTEFGRPQWTCGTATWTPAGESQLLVAGTTRGRWQLGTIDLRARSLRPLHEHLEPHEWLASSGRRAALVAGSPTRADAVVAIDFETDGVQVLRVAGDDEWLHPDFVSVPEAVTFAGHDGRATHAFYYAPRHRDVSGPPGARPPLVAIGHGGPTSAARRSLDLRIQFWTTRGFGVVDVNYGGSSGFGRAYRERLNGQWGIVDVADMVAAVQHLVDAGRAEPQRLVIRGGSAGGYTALAALVFRPGVFAAAASYYGVSDLEALARDTHKFESRYLDTLIGPYPEMRAEYRRRSPLYALEHLACALILLQGLDDRVVPPNQSETMADAVRRKGLPVAYVTFAAEQHGFRQKTSIVASLEAELYFYGAVFGFTPADNLPPLHIDNLP